MLLNPEIFFYTNVCQNREKRFTNFVEYALLTIYDLEHELNKIKNKT